MKSFSGVATCLYTLTTFAALAAGCGGGLKYRVDDGALDAVPAGERQGVFAAQNELEVAKSEQRTAQNQLDGWDRDRDIAKNEKEQAKLQVEKATAEQEAANASRNENQANALVPRRLDPQSKTPAFKSVPARVRPAGRRAARLASLRT